MRLTRTANATVFLALGIALCVAPACSKEGEATGAAPTTKVAATPIPPLSAPKVEGATQMKVTTGKATFLIDAPLEKIKGATEDVAGVLAVAPMDLTKTRGEVRFKLSTVATSTFDDAEKNKKQTEHARAWMGLGSEVPASERAAHEYARFVIQQVETATPKLADLPEKDGKRTANVKATGDLTLHGVTVKRTIDLTVEFQGPPDAPTELTVRTDKALDVSLKEHDIKPRDALGKFLDGALEKIGQKIDDRVQLSLQATAK